MENSEEVHEGKSHFGDFSEDGNKILQQTLKWDMKVRWFQVVWERWDRKLLLKQYLNILVP
jgi:hypothetical protein